MAQFYAEIQGGRGVGSRVGSKVSGIWGHIRGWGVGVKVRGHVTVSGEDEFHVYVTGGSRGHRSDRLIGTVLADGRFIPAETLKAVA
jgi:hypothetical protein